MRRIFALEDLEPAARRRLPPPIFGYVAGGAETNASLNDNRRVFDEIQFLPRMLVGVSGRTLECRLMAKDYALPFGIAPMGVTALTGYRGDLSLAKSASRAGIPMIISAASLIPLEEIAAAATGIWYQAYLSGDQTETSALMARVAQAGIDTFVITADSAVVPSRRTTCGRVTEPRSAPTQRCCGMGSRIRSGRLGRFCARSCSTGTRISRMPARAAGRRCCRCRRHATSPVESSSIGTSCASCARTGKAGW